MDCLRYFTSNLHTALVVNYPLNGLPGLSLLTQPVLTLTTASILLILFAVFVISLAAYSKRSRVALGIAIGLIGMDFCGLICP